MKERILHFIFAFVVVLFIGFCLGFLFTFPAEFLLLVAIIFIAAKLMNTH